MVENIPGKGENADDQHSPFIAVFIKVFVLKVIETGDCMIKTAFVTR